MKTNESITVGPESWTSTEQVAAIVEVDEGQTGDQTPGFEIILLLIGFTILIIWKRKRN